MEHADFKSLLNSLEEGRLISCVLSNPLIKGGLIKVLVKPTNLKSGSAFQLSEFKGKQVFHHNLNFQAVLEYLSSQHQHFKQILIYTTELDFHVLSNKKGALTILKKKASQQLKVVEHNRIKKRMLQEGAPLGFLIELDIMDAKGRVKSQSKDKFVQVNRFLETIQDLVPSLPSDKSLAIVDYGCGSALLTFALYYFLKEHLKRDVHMLGLDLKAEVIEKCRKLAQKLGFSQLHFEVQDILKHVPQKSIDMVVSLHACDIATDAVLERAIKWQVPIIIAVPCCQQEVLKQIDCHVLKPLLKHGVLKERFAALVTDAARAQILTMNGYHTQVIEFIDMEHTPKNMMIRAVKHNENVPKPAQEEYDQFVALLNIKPSLEKFLQY